MAGWGVRGFVALLVALVLALPVAAQAAGPAATITGCKVDHMTVIGRVVMSGPAARKARGATLQMRFSALALFGLPRTGDWRAVGKKLRASGQQDFSGLAAENWIGLLSWRYVKGRHTVASGDERSQPVRIGRARGQANCTLAEGAKPVDSTPPTLSINPADGNWHHAPVGVQLLAHDDFSGVKSVTYSLDGGPVTQLPNGGAFTIAAEGAHTVAWSATDVAGNTASRTDVVRVDAAPPTKPVVTSPPGATAHTQPTFSWTPSTDSGSGVRGYFLSIKRPDGSVVAQQAVDGNTTSVPSPATLTDGQTYVATVTAVDNTADKAWTTDSDPYTFRVDSQPKVTSTTPAEGTILSGSLKSGNLVINLDRPADPATADATLHNVDTNSDVAATSVGCAASPCTSIVFDPKSTLPEGRYTLTLGAVKSAEGPAFAPYTGHFSVPFFDGATLSASTSSICVSAATNTLTYTTTNGAGETGTLDFDWSASGSGGWSVQAQYGGNPAGGSDTAGGAGGSGHVHLGPFNLQSGLLTVKLTVECSSTSVQLTNVVGARVP